MATPSSPSPSPPPIQTNSHDTALCIVPPRHLWPSVDRLRALYDQAFLKWPPHVNLIYPFVQPDLLPEAAERIQTALSSSEIPPLRLSLDSAGVFTRKHDNIIYLHDSDAERCVRLKDLRNSIMQSLQGAAAHHASGQAFKMHMTVAQSEDVSSSTHKFLLDKVGLVPPTEWEVGQLFILVRERVQLNGSATNQMKIWGSITLSGELSRPGEPLPCYEETQRRLPPGTDGNGNGDDADSMEKDSLETHTSYCFDGETDLWLPFSPAANADTGETPADNLSIASFNVLAEFEFPPSEARYPLLLHNILAQDAAADILVLQEVTDGFLSYLLGDPAVRDRFPFSSHGPPAQTDVEPLPSLLNIVVLSRFSFDWEYVTFRRKHKGSVVARFRHVVEGPPLIVAAVHLNCGLTDGSIAVKKADVQRILKHLAETYAGHPWVLAGDFNISTSSYTIDAAVKKKAVSIVSANHLASISGLLVEAGLEDAWLEMRDRNGDEEDAEDDLLEGEQGATYDPIVNEVAAAIVGSGYGMRPQRYDRIFVRGEKFLQIAGFNRFGLRKGLVGDKESYASDHWGVRCVLKAQEVPEVTGIAGMSEEINKLVFPVILARAPAPLSGTGGVQETLAALGVIPGVAERQKRRVALSLLKSVIIGNYTTISPSNETSAVASRQQPVLVVVPVGSYGLDLWTSASDTDVLCIGPFSASTFFALALQRIRRASNIRDIRLLRRVRANTGTMLELEVLGIKMDLQYCPATSIAEQYPQVLRTPPSDPVWSLPPSTLSKLKALRDMEVLRHTIPDLSAFRVAHRFIKTWARARGIYSARFGFLGGIQISLLLARVCKLLPKSTSVPDLLTTFFTHYATFPWATHLVFDPKFHAERLPYTRTSREPLAILGYYPPALNTSHAASIPSTRVVTAEFSRVGELIHSSSAITSWEALLRPDGATEFLTSYTAYVRIDVQYWGMSATRGRRFVGWLESRCVLLLVDLHRRAAGLHARMWPARFVVVDGTSGDNQEQVRASGDDEEDKENTETEPRDYRGCYLIGLEKFAGQSMGKDELKAALGGLRTALHRFEELMRGDEKYFDAKSCWMSAEIVARDGLGVDNLKLDAREWGEYAAGDEEDEEDEDEDEEEAVLGEDDFNELEISATSRKSKKKKSARDEEPAPPKLETGKKFRTAADVMNRIRWDPQLDSNDFVVGYEDRFVGAREKALEAWKNEQTDEEFIPQHRILYFKRKSDGEVLWERRTRKDEIFGSGL